MIAELGQWNNGAGIDLESWVGCRGSFSLAVGYANVFWPSFVKHENYLLRSGFSEDAIRGFEKQTNSEREAVEIVMNHFHLADLQHSECEDISSDKLLNLGKVLKQIYEAKLMHDFPEIPCTVSFSVPEDPDDFLGYELTFWQS
jgi:hypothetical protein